MKIISGRINLLLLLIVLTAPNIVGQHGWTVNPADFAYNGSVTAIIILDSEEVTEGTMGAFVDGECRGYNDASYVWFTGKTIFRVMCYSNQASGEILNFQYYDPEGEGTYYDINETIEFTVDMIEGRSWAPLEFHITVNNSPVVSNPIEDQTLYENFATHIIDLSSVFSDPDGPVANYSAVSSNTSVVTVSVAGSILTISETGLGTSTITATLSDGEYSVDDVFDVTVYEIPDAVAGEDREICMNESTTLGATPIDGHTYSWTSDPAGFTSSEANPAVTPTVTTTYTLVETITATGATNSNSVTVTVITLPGDAGSISGPTTFTPGATGVEYSVPTIENATGYTWAYSGTGVIINGTGASVTLDFDLSATAGELSVKGTNPCGEGAESTLQIETGTKTLNLTSVMLQGLYSGSGEMNQAWDEFGPHWEAGVADHIIIELHNSTDYSTVVYTAEDVPLNTDGTASLSIPAEYDGSYYITIKHRNSVETTTASPVSFASGTISQSFGSKNDVYGKNLYKSDDGYYLIYTGDVNQDGFIDTQDFIGVDNDSYNYRSGYLVTDVDGNGVIDTNDYIFIDNNNYNYIGTIHP